MKITSLSEINRNDQLTDIVLHAEFTAEETASLELISPTIFVTLKDRGYSEITLCDEGLPVNCTFSDEELKDILDFVHGLRHILTGPEVGLLYMLEQRQEPCPKFGEPQL